MSNATGSAYSQAAENVSKANSAVSDFRQDRRLGAKGEEMTSTIGADRGKSTPHAAHRAVGQVHPQALGGYISADILETQNIRRTASRASLVHVPEVACVPTGPSFRCTIDFTPYQFQRST